MCLCAVNVISKITKPGNVEKQISTDIIIKQKRIFTMDNKKNYSLIEQYSNSKWPKVNRPRLIRMDNGSGNGNGPK